MLFCGLRLIFTFVRAREKVSALDTPLLRALPRRGCRPTQLRVADARPPRITRGRPGRAGWAGPREGERSAARSAQVSLLHPRNPSGGRDADVLPLCAHIEFVADRSRRALLGVLPAVPRPIPLGVLWHTLRHTPLCLETPRHRLRHHPRRQVGGAQRAQGRATVKRRACAPSPFACARERAYVSRTAFTCPLPARSTTR